MGFSCLDDIIELIKLKKKKKTSFTDIMFPQCTLSVETPGRYAATKDILLRYTIIYIRIVTQFIKTH